MNHISPHPYCVIGILSEHEGHTTDLDSEQEPPDGPSTHHTRGVFAPVQCTYRLPEESYGYPHDVKDDERLLRREQKRGRCLQFPLSAKKAETGHKAS